MLQGRNSLFHILLLLICHRFNNKNTMLFWKYEIFNTFIGSVQMQHPFGCYAVVQDFHFNIRNIHGLNIFALSVLCHIMCKPFSTWAITSVNFSTGVLMQRLAGLARGTLKGVTLWLVTLSSCFILFAQEEKQWNTVKILNMLIFCFWHRGVKLYISYFQPVENFLLLRATFYMRITHIPV